MNKKLDLFNAAKDYAENVSKNEAVILIAHDKKSGELITALNGDVDILSMVMSSGDEYINFDNEEKEQKFDECRKAFLNIALNILRLDETRRVKFQGALEDMDKGENANCLDCGYEWDPIDTEHLNFTCCPLCGSDNVD